MNADLRIGQQARHPAVQSRPAANDGLVRLDPAQRQRMQWHGRPRRRGLGNGRKTGQLGVDAGPVPGDDDRVEAQVDRHGDVEPARGSLCPRQSVLAAAEPGKVVVDRRPRTGDQGLAQWNVELDRSGVARAGAPGRRQHAPDGRAPLAVGVHTVLGQSDADGRAHLGAEQAELLDRLIGTGSE